MAFIASMAQDARVMQFVGDGQLWTDAYVRQRLAEAVTQSTGSTGHVASWYIGTTGDSGSPVGLLSLTPRRDAVEVGFWVPFDEWGNGVAGRLLEHGRAIAQQRWPHQSLVGLVDPRNEASRHVMKRAGFIEDRSESALQARFEMVRSDEDAPRRSTKK